MELLSHRPMHEFRREVICIEKYVGVRKESTTYINYISKLLAEPDISLLETFGMGHLWLISPRDVFRKDVCPY